MRIIGNRIVTSLFNNQKPQEELASLNFDPRFVASVNLAIALIPCERGEILSA